MKAKLNFKKYTQIVMYGLLLAGLTGCGAWQTVKDGTVKTSSSIFFSKLKVLKLDIIARHGVNQTERGQSLSTVVRIYQLKDNQSFDAAAYRDLLNQDTVLLGDNLLASKQLTFRPGEAISVDEEIHPDTKYVGLVAFFNRGDDSQTWKVLIPKKKFSNKKALVIELKEVGLYMQDGKKADK